MKGLELCRKYYEAYGAPMLGEFPELSDKLAVGLLGSGSECFGFDDDISRDHDFEPGFCIFLPEEDEVDRRTAFLLERAYAKLPAEFEGVKRQKISPVGGNRHGVMRLSEFLTEKLGSAEGTLTDEQWLKLPSNSIAELLNGEIYFDGAGRLTAVRNYLSQMPEDIRRKRLAGQLLLMAQAGQYNYMRTIGHGETGAAQLAVAEFVKAAMESIFLLNRTYMPYYKWSFRALRALPTLSNLADSLEYLLSSDNGAPEEKYFLIEEIAAQLIEELQNQKLTEAICGDLEKHAYSVNDGIEDGAIRNLHILYTV